MIGQFAVSKAGHDKGNLYVVIADGKAKTQEKPKKKRRKHIQPINRDVEEGLLRKLQACEKIYPEEIRYAIRQYELDNSSNKE